MKVQDFIAKYQTNPSEACDWLIKNTTSLKFDKLQDFLDLIKFFQDHNIQRGSQGPLLFKVARENAAQIIALFDTIDQFENLLNKDSTNRIHYFLVREATPLLDTVQNLEQLFRLMEKPNWKLAFVDNRKALEKICLLFKNWQDILTYSEKLHFLPDLFTINPKHFANLFSSSEQIIQIYKKDSVCACRLVRALGTEIAPLYSTTEELQPLKLMSSEVADAIAKQRNITLITAKNSTNFSFNTNTDRSTPAQSTGKKPVPPSISWMILGGFIAVLGIATMALTFVFLNVGIASLALAGAGLVATLIGIGMFKGGLGTKEPEPAESLSAMP